MPKIDTAAAPAPGEPRPNSKITAVTALLSRPGGATLDELMGATGWQPHTTRAALTGLKKKGHTIDRERVDGTGRYRIRNAVGR